MHYYKSNNEIMQYCIVSNDIALIMHYRALLKRSGLETPPIVNEFLDKSDDTVSMAQFYFGGL